MLLFLINFSALVLLALSSVLKFHAFNYPTKLVDFPGHSVLMAMTYCFSKDWGSGAKSTASTAGQWCAVGR